MVQSLNTKVDLVIDATAFTGLTDYGQIMIGDRGFEFYHAKDPRMRFKPRKMGRIRLLQKSRSECYELFVHMLTQIIWSNL